MKQYFHTINSSSRTE